MTWQAVGMVQYAIIGLWLLGLRCIAFGPDRFPGWSTKFLFSVVLV